MKKIHKVNLSSEERSELIELTMSGKAKVRQLKRAQILLHAHKGKIDKEIAEAVGTSLATVQRIRQKYATESLKSALTEKPRSGRPIGIDGKTRAKVTALACTEAPEGRSDWTLRLIAEKVVELEYIDAISYQTVRNILKKTS